MTKTLHSLSHKPHKVYCRKHETVAKAPNEAIALWLAAEHESTFKECKGKVSVFPTEPITKEGGAPKPGSGGGIEGGGGGVS